MTGDLTQYEQEFGSRFGKLVQSNPMGIHMYKLEDDGRLLFTGANPSADIILQLDNSKFIGKTIEEAFPNLTTTEIPDSYRKVCKDGTPYHSPAISYSDSKLKGIFEVHAFQTSPDTMAVLFRDISEERALEKAFKESEERIKRFYDASFEGIAVTRNGRVIDVNQRFCDFYGYTYEEIIGKSVLEFVVEEDKELVCKNIKDKINTPYEHKGVHKDGSILHLEVRGQSIKLNGQDARITAIHDITESKRNEDRFESLLKLMEMDTDSEGFLADHALKEAVRLTDSAIGYLHFVEKDSPLSMGEGKTRLEFFKWSKSLHKNCTAVPEEHYPLNEAEIWADCVRLREPVIHNDYPNIPGNKGLPEGHFPLHRHLSVPVFDGERIVAVAGVGNKKRPYDDADVRQLSLFMNSMWDIIKRFRAEQALRKEKENLQLYLDIAASIFIVLDKYGNINMINKHGCDIIGCALEEDILGKDWVEEFIPEDEKEMVLAEFQSLIDGEKDWSVMENSIINLHNEIKIIKWKNTILRDESGVIAFTLSSGEDLTEQRVLEAKQKEYWVEAEKMLSENIIHIKKSFSKYHKTSSYTSTQLDTALMKLNSYGKE